MVVPSRAAVVTAHLPRPMTTWPAVMTGGPGEQHAPTWTEEERLPDHWSSSWRVRPNDPLRATEARTHHRDREALGRE